MTSREVYNLNKEMYDKEALEYLDTFLKNKGDLVHRPFEMMTHYSRCICEKINDNDFLSFTGYVKDITYSDSRTIEKYTGNKDDAKVIDKKRIIEMFGFEISINPNSKSNREISSSIA